MTRASLALLALLLAAAPAALAAEADAPEAAPDQPAADNAAPADDPEPAGDKIRAVVKVVEGTVLARSAVGEEWKPVEVGQELEEGADIVTGLRARCVLDMTDSLFQVDPVSTVRIGQLRQEGDTVRTRLYLKQGNLQGIVEKGRIKSDCAVVTPSATLSVRGTRGIRAGHAPVFGSLLGLTGPGQLAILNFLGRERGLGQGEWTDQHLIQAIDFLSNLRMQKMNDLFGGMTRKEILAANRRNNAFQVTPTVIGPPGMKPRGFNPTMQRRQLPIISPTDGRVLPSDGPCDLDGGSPGV